MIKNKHNYSDVIRASLSLKSPATELFIQKFFHNNNEETVKLNITDRCEGNTSDRWIPHTERL